MEIIKSKEGTRIRIGKTRLRTVDECHEYLFLLKDLKTGNRQVRFIGKPGCILGKFTTTAEVDVEKRAIGCQSFSIEAWAKIVKAARKTRRANGKSR